MAITYNAGTNAITVTGYTEGTPCNFTDIYNADVASAWGKVTRQCTNQFCFTAKLIVGDGSTVTWLADTKVDVRFSGIITSTWGVMLDVKANAHFRLGVLVDDSKKITKHGGSLSINDLNYRHIFIQITTNSYIEIYNSKLNAGSSNPNSYEGFFGSLSTYEAPALFKVYNVVCENVTFLNMSNLNIYNVTMENSGGALFTVAGNIEKISSNGMLRRTFALALNISSTFKNIISKGAPTYDIYTNNTTGTGYFINCDFDRAWLFWWNNAPYPTVYRQYEFDLEVIDKDNGAINGATVKIWDKDSTLVVDTTTDVNGFISTQTITRGTYTQPTGNTLQDKSPHLIKITKAGYTMYEADFTLDDKTDWLIALQVGGGLLRNPSMTGGMV